MFFFSSPISNNALQDGVAEQHELLLDTKNPRSILQEVHSLLESGAEALHADPAAKSIININPKVLR